VAIAEIAFGIQKIDPGQRAARLEQGLAEWRRRFADRIFGFTEAAALTYGDIIGGAARQGRPMSAPDGYDRGDSARERRAVGDSERG
jgi:predicted nucleic acid-binding protein